MAVQLGRSDTPSVWLTAAPSDQTEVLAHLAELGAAGRVPWLIGRHLIVIDPTAVPPTSEERLAIDLTYKSIRLVLAIDQTETRLGKHLIRTAVAAGVPTILLGDRWQPRSRHTDLGSPPMVKVKPHHPEPPAVVDLLAPIGERLAALHRVTLAPGVLDAAATPAPQPVARHSNPFVQFPDDDRASAEGRRSDRPGPRPPGLRLLPGRAAPRPPGHPRRRPHGPPPGHPRWQHPRPPTPPPGSPDCWQTRSSTSPRPCAASVIA